MSQIKTREQIEFADLYRQLEAHTEGGGAKLLARDVAEKLKRTPAALSMILAGKRSPDPLTLDALRRLVTETCSGGQREPQATLREAVESETERWRRRALAAEKELAELRRALRELAGAPATGTGAGYEVSSREVAPPRAEHGYGREHRSAKAGGVSSASASLADKLLTSVQAAPPSPPSRRRKP